MTTSSAAKERSASVWQARGLAGWLALMASPILALMAWIAANDAPPAALCPGSSILPLGDMTMMYVLMSLFHLPPWLKLVSGRSWARTTTGDRP